MKTKLKQYIRNCSKFRVTEDEGMDCFRENFNEFKDDFEFISEVLNLYSINYFQKKELIKFPENTHQTLIDFIIDTLSRSPSVIQKKKTKGTIALTINPTNLDQCFNTLIWFFKKEKRFTKLCETMIGSAISWIEENEDKIKSNNSEAIQEFYSVTINFSKVIDNPNFVKTENIYKDYLKKMEDLFTKYPSQTLTCCALKGGFFNEKHKECLNEIDQVNLSRKRLVALKQIEYFNKEVLINNPELNELFEFAIREKSDLDFITEEERPYLNLKCETQIGKLKSRSNYVDITLILKALSEETRFSLLSRFDITKITSGSEFSKDCLRLSDDFGYINEEDLDFIEMSYCC